jgi:hypothetical protein
MKRFFYTDPLAAAWMTAKFGMEFIDLITGRIEPSDIGTALFSRGYIAPGSLHLLEPQIGDTCDVMEDEWNVSRRVNDVYDREAFKAGWKLERIIDRFGIAFMWPESEGA